jgi:hypothetical protein
MSTLQDFHQFIAVQMEDYDQCIEVLEHDFNLSDVPGTIRLHYLKCDGNGRPMVKALAEILYDYIIHYCIAAKNRDEPLTPQQAARLSKEARKLFRHPALKDGEEDTTGEAGETLLFFLTEAILRAPQIVAKMELKTNSNDEVKGSDGIHARWNNDDGVVDFFFGESKLYQNANSAVSAAIKSISQFHDNEMYKHEFSLVTKHFKYADENVREQLRLLLRSGEPAQGARLNHACLIGFDSPCYDVTAKRVQNKIADELLKDGEKITKKLNEQFADFDKKYLNFDIFLIPFPSVAEFRRAFNSALD